MSAIGPIHHPESPCALKRHPRPPPAAAPPAPAPGTPSGSPASSNAKTNSTTASAARAPSATPPAPRPPPTPPAAADTTAASPSPAHPAATETPPPFLWKKEKVEPKEIDVEFGPIQLWFFFAYFLFVKKKVSALRESLHRLEVLPPRRRRCRQRQGTPLARLPRPPGLSLRASRIHRRRDRRDAPILRTVALASRRQRRTPPTPQTIHLQPKTSPWRPPGTASTT